jgi:DNA-binding transcriptional ArsR family regulator
MKSPDAIVCLGALAQETRLGIFRLLVKRGPRGYTPGELAAKTETPAPTLSFHLKELQRAELISARRDGRFLYYSANFVQMQQLVDYLTENCCSLAEEGCDAACRPASASQVSTQVNTPVKRKRA